MATQERAQGLRVLVVKAAEADAEAQELAGHGVAKQRSAIVEGLQASVEQFSTGVAGAGPADVMQLMMVTQYLDMLKDVGTSSGTECVFVPHDDGSLGSMIRQGVMEGQLGESGDAPYGHGTTSGQAPISQTGETKLMSVTCPSTSKPGDLLSITVSGRKYNVQVPVGTLPGAKFQVRL
eukprot:SAG31_NODE_1333_length_8743_cov_1.681050_8_plen_179_part_00